MDSRIGTSRSRASASASSPQGNQSTGLWACWSRYGLVSSARRFTPRSFSRGQGVARWRAVYARSRTGRSQRWTRAQTPAPAGRCFRARHMEQATSITRVLVVDDHEMFSEALELLLRRQPDVRLIGSARDATEALGMLEDEPDVVLMDLDMPGTDGIQATRQIREAVPNV